MDEQPAILLIDDEPRLRNNLQILLRREGYRVTSAQNGQDGVKKAQEQAFDLVITDIVMPDGDGFYVMDFVKSHQPDTVVLAMTAHVSMDSAIEALRAGAYDYLSKPFDFDIMKITIDRALEKVRLQKTLRRYTSELEQKVQERTRELTEANQKLEQSLTDLKAAQEHLIQAEKLSALGELVAGVAHELNSPLSTITLNAQLVTLGASLEGNAKTQLERISDAATHCQSVVKSLVSFGRKHKPEMASIDINALCEKVLELLAYQLKVSHVELETKLDPSLPPTMADPHQLQQVFINLASNASQAMANHAGRGKLTVSTRAGDGVVEVRFQDDGPGISKEHQRKIFDPFFTTKADGTGLGLSISYGIVKEHGGEITVQSEMGGGTTFVVTLPIRQPADVPASQTAAAAAV